MRNFRVFIYVMVLVFVAVAHGIWDVHQADATPLNIGLAIPCFVLGVLFPRFWLVSGGGMVVGLYLSHVVAIALLGYKQPYVEADVASALWCFRDIPLSLICSLAGWSIGTLFCKENWRKLADD